MSSLPNLKRLLAVGTTGGVFIAILLVAGLGGSSGARYEADASDQVKASSSVESTDEHRTFGGTLQRNMVNTSAKNLPVEFSVDEGSKDVKWAADLGSKAYGGPIIAGGKVFVGTNNMKPRDKKFVDNGQPIDMGIVMAFN